MAESIPTGTHALTFSFSTQTLRVVMIDGEPWFVASDVCEALTISTEATRRLDDDEKGLRNVQTLGGQQEMTIINESGLYSLILTSRKPEAKKFKKWVTSEVLPSIRKTGRYELPQAPQTPPPNNTAERLSGNDLANIKRMIGLCTKGFQNRESWNQAIWFYLRRVLNWPSPQPWTVDHLPRLGEELTEAMESCYAVQALIRQIEHQAVKKLFRDAAHASSVIEYLTKTAETEMAQLKVERAKLPSYLIRSELPNLIGRKPAFVGFYVADEQPDLFRF